MQLGPGGLIRSKTGCLTCRRTRHVKCDETKPVCIRCQKSKKKCGGYPASQSPSTRGTSPPDALPLLPKFEHGQRESFGFFVTCITNLYSLHLGGDFWARRVLQLSLSDASIRYALCSLSALHRMSTVPALKTQAQDHRNYALEQYAHAIKCTQKLLSESLDGSEDKLIKGLVACALFVCYENFTGNSQTAHMHLQNGLQILAKERFRHRRMRIPKDIIQTFKRLDLQALTFGDCAIPCPADNHGLYQQSMEPPCDPPQSLNLFEDPTDVVFMVCRWLFREGSHADSCPLPASNIKAAIAHLEQANFDVERFLKLPNSSANERPAALLKMYDTIMVIVLTTQIHRRETLHDNHLLKYQQVVALGEALLRDSQASPSTHVFSFDIGLIFPLFWVATRCRDSRTRWHALELLRSMKHQEGTWKSANAATVAEFVILVEEEGLPAGVCQEKVPESARVHVVSTAADAEEGKIKLSCLMREDDEGDGEGWYTIEGVVPYFPMLEPA